MGTISCDLKCYYYNQGQGSVSLSKMGNEPDFNIDSFPYPSTISQDDFQCNGEEVLDVDSFLFKNHRFTSLDLLRKELSQLLDSLNRELLELVNKEHANFINLGKSIDGSLDLLHRVQSELQEFNITLDKTRAGFTVSEEYIKHGLERRTEILRVKMCARICLLLGDQVYLFERLLSSTDAPLKQKLHKLATLFISISKLYAKVKNETVLINLHLKEKISSLKLEFENYLKEITISSKKAQTVDNELLFEIMEIYNVTGHQLEFLRLIRRSS